MSYLIVIGYENPQTAQQAYEQVQRLQQDFIVDLRGLAIVNVDADGKTHVDTPKRIIGNSAVSGALFGLLLGPGHSAVVMASKITEDKFTSAMQPFGGTILKTSLSESDEKELAEELAGRG